jgi:hypothetical protein
VRIGFGFDSGATGKVSGRITGEGSGVEIGETETGEEDGAVEATLE